MRAHTRISLASAALAAALAAATPAPALASPDDEVVECKLPPQIRSLGSHATYLAAGRIVHVSVAECKTRGGSWNGRGPGKYAGADANGPLAVTVGGEGKGAACPLQARVRLQGTGTLSVRAGPGTAFAKLDRLANGAHVFLCDRSGAAGWVGVVYGPGDCGLSAPINPPRPYEGACHSGWVRSDFLR